MTNISRCENLIAGMGIGDAAAAPYEHLSQSLIEDILDLTGYPERPSNRSMRVPGKYTDDTQMAVAVTELLYYGEKFDQNNLANHIYMTYHRDKRPGYSKYTTYALESPTTEEYMANIKHTVRNGAIPRNVPIGVLTNTDKVIDYAIINSELDHNTLESITSSVFVALASHYMFHEPGNPEKIYRFCIDKMMDHHAYSLFDEDTLEYLLRVSLMNELDKDILFEDNPMNNGVPVDAKKTAGAVLYILTNHSDNVYETLRESILLGGDTDTVAATCLGMVASRKGLEGLPKSLTDNFEDGEYGINYLCDTGKKLATVLPIELKDVERRDNPERRKFKLINGLDGIMQATDMRYQVELMRRLLADVPYKPSDFILGIEATGYIPAAAASMATGLQLVCAKKTDLVTPEDRSVIRFEEPSSPREKLFIYGLFPGDRVIIIDDEIRTGKTSENLYNALTEQGIDILAIVNPIESNRYGAREKIKSLGLDLISHTSHNLP